MPIEPSVNIDEFGMVAATSIDPSFMELRESAPLVLLDIVDLHCLFLSHDTRKTRGTADDNYFF